MVKRLDLFLHKRKGTKMAKDPVCGMEVEKKKAAATLMYGDQTFYFCAEACKRAFEKDPQKYIS